MQTGILIERATLVGRSVASATRSKRPPLLVVTLSLVCALGACSSKVEEAEKRYNLASKSGTAVDICEAGRAVVAAYLEAGDAEKFKARKFETVLRCYNARSAEGKPVDNGELERVLSNDAS